MPERIGYFGEVGKYELGWWNSRWRGPIATAGNQTLTRHDTSDANYQYYTSNKSTLTLEANEYPVSIQFYDYTGSGWWANSDSYDSQNPATATAYLCYSSGETNYAVKKIAEFSISRGQGIKPTKTYSISSGSDLAGKALQIYVTGNRGVWFNGQCTVKVTTAYSYSKCGEPGNVQLSDPMNGELTMSWSAGTDGTNNPISKYEIQYRDNPVGTWGPWQSIGSVNASTLQASVYLSPENGCIRQFRVRAVGTAGTAWASDYVTSSTKMTHSTPPTFDINITPPSPVSITDGHYVKSASNIVASITNASAASPKTIVSYSISTQDYGSSTTSTFTSSTLTAAGDVTITFTVTDSEGYSTTETRTITVEDYYPPGANIVFARCDNAQMDVNPAGEYIMYKATAFYTHIGNNSIEAVDVSIGTTYYETLTADDNWHVLPGYTQPANVRREVFINVDDKFMTGGYSAIIPSASYAIYLNDDGTAIGFGAATERTNSVEIARERTLYVSSIKIVPTTQGGTEYTQADYIRGVVNGTIT